MKSIAAPRYMAIQSDRFFSSRFLPLFLILGLFLVYAVFPTQNPTSDSLDYAACVKWQVDLWQPHHLLYNISGLGIYTLLQNTGIAVAPLELLQLLNSCFAGASLFVLWRILAQLQPDARIQAGLVFLAGASFGTMRYATENETYILPIFFSALGSYFWCKYQTTRKIEYILGSSFWAAVACLYHQVHFFWWLGLLLSVGITSGWNWKKISWFVLPAGVVPLGYAVVMALQHIPYSQAPRFVFLDFYKGEVESAITYKNFLLTGISLIRTFLEVHGRLYYLGKQNLFYIIPALVTSFLFSLAFRSYLRTRRNLALLHPSSFWTHAAILGMQLLFAWFAVGNAEFMVMVPILLAISLGSIKIEHPGNLFLLGTSLLLWNLAYAVLPSYFYTYTNHACTLAYVKQHPQAVLLLEDKNAFDTYLFYHTGKYHPNAYEISAPAPVLRETVAKAIQANQPVVTDFPAESSIMNRAWFLNSRNRAEFFSSYQLAPTTSCSTLFGNKGLYLVKTKHNSPHQ